METAAILAGLALIGAALVVDQIERLKPALQPIRARREPPKRRS